MLKTSSLQFRALPLQEVSIRATPAPHVGWELQEIFDAWHEFDADIWSPTFISTFETPPGLGGFGFRVGSGPSGWKLQSAAGEELFFQEQLFKSSWIKDLDTQQRGYPRYRSLKEKLIAMLAATSKAMNVGQIPIGVINMSYTNAVEANPAAGFIQDYLSEVAQFRLIDDASSARNLSAAWSTENQTELRFTLSYNEEVNQFIIQTVAGKFLHETERQIEWQEELDMLHERLQDIMEMILTEKAKEIWEYQGRNDI